MCVCALVRTVHASCVVRQRTGKRCPQIYTHTQRNTHKCIPQKYLLAKSHEQTNAHRHKNRTHTYRINTCTQRDTHTHLKRYAHVNIRTQPHAHTNPNSLRRDKVCMCGLCDCVRGMCIRCVWGMLCDIGKTKRTVDLVCIERERRNGRVHSFYHGCVRRP